MTTIVFFREEDQSTPFLDWFDSLPVRAKVQCRARLELLAKLPVAVAWLRWRLWSSEQRPK